MPNSVFLLLLLQLSTEQEICDKILDQGQQNIEQAAHGADAENTDKLLNSVYAHLVQVRGIDAHILRIFKSSTVDIQKKSCFNYLQHGLKRVPLAIIIAIIDQHFLFQLTSI